MQRMIHQLREQREDGATAVVVAITLMVLLGFAGFGIDVTSAYAKSQEVQNAADAAALATAQHCAKEDVTCSDGSQAGPATLLAQDNVRLQVDEVTAQDTYPTSNRVTVQVTAEHQNFFAGLFGFNSFTVVRDATAQWDAPHSGPAMLPLTISACTFFEQTDSDGDPIIPQDVNLWLPMPGNSFKNGECSWHDQYPGGGFGWLDYDPGTCESDVGVGEPPAAGNDPGNDVPGCVKNVVQEAISNGDVLLVPIFSSTNGENGNNAEYHMLRFAAIKLVGMQYHTGSPSFIGIKCGDKPIGPDGKSNYYSNTCLNGVFVDWVEIGEDYTGGGPETEVSVIRLIDPDFEDNN